MKFGLIGSDLKGSQSKLIHAFIFENFKYNDEYDFFQLKEDEVDAFCTYAKENLNGFNVTFPYKEKVFFCCDELDISGKEAKAVNTVLVKDGKLVGFNTDGDGFLNALKFNEISLAKKRVLVIGAGGASKGILTALKKKVDKKNIFLTNRTREKGQFVASCLDVAYTENKSNFDIYVNAISEYDSSIVDGEDIKNSEFVYDINYKRESAFLKLGREKGIRCDDGFSMLFFQALKAEEIWHGTEFSKSESENLFIKLKEKIKE